MKQYLRISMLLLLGLVLLGLLPAAMHHHHDDGGQPCWYCIAVAGALLPLCLALLAPPLPFAPAYPKTIHAPAWLLWVTHHRRGPPQVTPELNPHLRPL